MPSYNQTKRGKYDRVLVIADEKQRALDLSQMKLIPPEVGIFDAPTRCYEINVEWAKIVMGMVGWLAEVAVWRDAEDEGYDAIRQIQEFKVGTDCMKFQLRQNEDNLCLLEQSLDGGETWETAFDYSLCAGTQEPLDPVDTEPLYAELSALNTAYNGTTASVAPNAVFDGTVDDADRNFVICATTSTLISDIVRLERERRTRNTVGLVVAGIITILLAGLVAATGGTATPLALALAGVLLGGAGIGVQSLSESALSDYEAREAVACCMYQSLKDTTLTEPLFQTSLDNCNFAFGTHEAQIAGAIAPMLQDRKVYLAFLARFEYIWSIRDVYPIDCPCVSEVCTQWDTWNPVPSGWTMNVVNNVTSALWATANNGRKELRFQYDAPDPIEFKNIKIRCERNGHGDVQNLTVTGYLDGIEVFTDTQHLAYSGGANPVYVKEFPYEGQVDRIEVFGDVSNTTAGFMGIVEVAMEFMDNGFVPAGNEDCSI